MPPVLPSPGQVQCPGADAAWSQAGVMHASPSHMPPASMHARASHAGGTTYAPSTQLPPLCSQVAVAQVMMQASPLQLPPAVAQLSVSHAGGAGGSGSNGGASSLLPSGPTSGGFAHAITNVGIEKCRPLLKLGLISVLRLSTPVSSSNPAKPALHAVLVATARNALGNTWSKVK